MSAPAKNLELYKRNYGNGIPSWSPLYHEDEVNTPSPNLIGNVLLPHSMRTIPAHLTAGPSPLDILKAANSQKDRPPLGWSAQETAVGCRIRDYGSGVPHWSPLYGGSEWRKGEVENGQTVKYKDFKTGEISDQPSAR